MGGVKPRGANDGVQFEVPSVDCKYSVLGHFIDFRRDDRNVWLYQRFQIAIAWGESRRLQSFAVDDSVGNSVADLLQPTWNFGIKLAHSSSFQFNRCLIISV